jgi:hypothetical protein
MPHFFVHRSTARNVGLDVTINLAALYVAEIFPKMPQGRTFH